MLSGKKTLREFGASCTVSTFPWRENMFLPQLDGVVYQEPGIQAPGLHQCLSLFTALRREARWGVLLSQDTLHLVIDHRASLGFVR